MKPQVLKIKSHEIITIHVYTNRVPQDGTPRRDEPRSTLRERGCRKVILGRFRKEDLNDLGMKTSCGGLIWTLSS